MELTKFLRYFLEFGNYGYYKEFKIFKIPFRFPKYSRTDEIFIQTRLANIVQNTHSKLFTKYKNIYNDKSIVLVATGPTLNYYQPLQDVINIGVNKAFLREDIPFDYLFAIDRGAILPFLDDIGNYRKDKCTKFFGICPYLKNRIVYNDALRAGADCFYTSITFSHALPDISAAELPDLGSVIFPAIMFALWTNPKRIYLVGCDCSSGYFYDTKSGAKNTHQVKGWKKMRKFVQLNYPDTEIISINPIGLRGLFKDVYTSDFAAKLPEEQKKNIEIL